MLGRLVNRVSKHALKAVNPHAKTDQDTRTPEQLLDLIEAKGREVAAALAALRSLTQPDP